MNATESRKPNISQTDPETVLLRKLQDWRKERASKGDVAAVCHWH